MQLTIRPREGSAPGEQVIEVVERKGLGHPDTICDAIAENVSRQLCRTYAARFGVILHHNVDKILLCGGAARPAFGGGEVLEPLEIYLAGRATSEARGERIPVAEIAVEACRDWLRQNLPELDLDRHVRIIPRLRPGSADLTGLFSRAHGAPLANDTSCGVGFAPLTQLEKVVLAVEHGLNGEQAKAMHPAIGRDIKVMGVRQRDRIELTIACAFVARHIPDLSAYARARDAVQALACAAARTATHLEVAASVNTGDDLSRGEVYLTVTGTSAEAGDDGEVGRGNRANGLITPYRPMTLEAAAGKNPVNHVGKLYNVVAHRIPEALVRELPQVRDATCVLVSRIGQPIDDPAVVDLQLGVTPTQDVDALLAPAARVVRSELAALGEVRRALLDGRLNVY